MKSRLTNKAIFSLQRLIRVATLLNRFREIIAEQNIFDDYVPDETKTRIIPFESLGGNGIVKGFPPDKVKIDGKEICKSIYIGICNDVLKGDVKAIIPYELVKISE